MLVSAAREAEATLVAVGAPATGRLGGIVLGSVGTHLLHSAPCSVLIARPPADETAFPWSIVVGHDGSRGAASHPAPPQPTATTTLSQTASAERSPGALVHAAAAEERCLINQALEVPVHVSVRVKALDDIPAT